MDVTFVIQTLFPTSHTVDGSEIRRENHLGCIKPCKSWDKHKSIVQTIKMRKPTVDGSEILHQMRLVVYSLQGFIHPRWCSPQRLGTVAATAR